MNPAQIALFRMYIWLPIYSVADLWLLVIKLVLTLVKLFSWCSWIFDFMAFDLKNWLDFQFFGEFPMKRWCASLRSAHKIFQKKKKKKRKPFIQVEGFKKASFFKKILPHFITFWVEIFLKTRRAWTCFFEYPELTFALFFLFFCFVLNSISIKKDRSSMKLILKSGLSQRNPRKGYEVFLHTLS